MGDQVQPPETQIQVKPGACDPTDNLSTPAADVFETEGEIVILMDVPGVESDDVDVDLRDGSLSVTAKRKESEDRGVPIFSEYQRCGYFRYFRIPMSVDQTHITASLTDGVLRLVLPKAGRSVSRMIRLRTD